LEAPLAPYEDGEGSVFDGEKLIASVHYKIHVSNVFSEDATMDLGRYSRLQEKQMTLELSPSVPFNAGALILQLNDGRKLKFVVSENSYIPISGIFK
jgi:hypothetical protein